MEHSPADAMKMLGDIKPVIPSGPDVAVFLLQGPGGGVLAFWMNPEEGLIFSVRCGHSGQRTA